MGRSARQVLFRQTSAPPEKNATNRSYVGLVEKAGLVRDATAAPQQIAKNGSKTSAYPQHYGGQKNFSPPNSEARSQESVDGTLDLVSIWFLGIWRPAGDSPIGGWKSHSGAETSRKIREAGGIVRATGSMTMIGRIWIALLRTGKVPGIHRMSTEAFLGTVKEMWLHLPGR